MSNSGETMIVAIIAATSYRGQVQHLEPTRRLSCVKLCVLNSMATIIVVQVGRTMHANDVGE